MSEPMISKEFVDYFEAPVGTQPTVRWFVCEEMSVYVRRNCVCIEGEFRPMMQVASVVVEDEFRGQGLFTRFMAKLFEMKLGAYEGVYVENVLNDDFQDWFRDRGWNEITYGHVNVCSYWKEWV